jgi:hypothetical protein
MKLFFVVLFCVLAAGFISWLTLSLADVQRKHPEAFPKQPPAGVQPGN